MRILSVPWPRVQHSHAVADREPDVELSVQQGPFPAMARLRSSSDIPQSLILQTEPLRSSEVCTVGSTQRKP